MFKIHFEFTDIFKKFYQKLPKNIQQKTDKTLLLLEQNPSHPSLKVKKMEGTQNIYEWRISDNYRGTFQKIGNMGYLRKVGTHDILKTP
jgi:mRNA-degrading endonuclease RelE of RelBE toxin-antitoxin system